MRCRRAAARYDRLDGTFLANLRLIPIAIQLKNTSKTNQYKHTLVMHAQIYVRCPAVDSFHIAALFLRLRARIPLTLFVTIRDSS